MVQSIPRSKAEVSISRQSWASASLCLGSPSIAATSRLLYLLRGESLDGVSSGFVGWGVGATEELCLMLFVVGMEKTLLREDSKLMRMGVIGADFGDTWKLSKKRRAFESSESGRSRKGGALNSCVMMSGNGH